jgi:HK97 family phage major capsid protein
MNDEVSRLEDAELAFSLAETRGKLAAFGSGPLKASEQRDADRLTAKAEAFENEIDRRRRMANAVAAVPGRGQDLAPAGSLARVNDASVYFPGSGTSYFRDLWARQTQGDSGAADRLLRHGREMAGTPENKQLAVIEKRDLSIGGGVADFIPPLYLQDEWAELARAGRPLADFIGPRPLADSGMTLTVPKIATGATVAMQTVEAEAPSETDATDTTVTFAVKTAAGQQDLSVQLFERSSPGMDQVIGADLAAAYATNVSNQVINGSDASGQVEGILAADSVNAVTYTDASPTAGELYAKIADGVQRIHGARFLPPQVIVMGPRRWGFFLAERDTTGRPLFIDPPEFSPMGRRNGVVPEGVVGSMQGLPVLVDPSIPTTLGASTDEDRVLVLRSSDLLLFESPVRARVLSEVLSGTLQVRLQVYGYLAFTAERFPQSVSIILGTGLKPPTFV